MLYINPLFWRTIGITRSKYKGKNCNYSNKNTKPETDFVFIFKKQLPPIRSDVNEK